MTEEIAETIVEESPAEILEKLEKANQENRDLLLKIETAKAKEALGGKSEGGIRKPEVPKEDQVKEDLNKMFGVNSPYYKK
jgi:hypothetical protein